MNNRRLTQHPVLHVPAAEEITFYWNKTPLTAKRGEMISSALYAAGIRVFGHHHKDGGAQGIFCANGQCAKCAVIANGVPVKSCMTAVTPNMMVESVEGLPQLPVVEAQPDFAAIPEETTDVLIIGGGPAGLSAALELPGFKVLVVDDKATPGGKLVLQTHKFFGSVADSHAGTRGNDIGHLLTEQAQNSGHVTIWTNSTVLYVFKDKKVGILRDGQYHLVNPKLVINAAGAREKFLRFPGNSLAGIYGAGAFQTLVNRDLIKPTERLFIIGGGNVGLIAGYHALQAGIQVVGLAEALPACGGYKVHADKLHRLGVPIYTSHTVLYASGKDTVESVTIARVDDKFNPVPGTEKTFACDTVLIAVGLESLSEFTQEAEKAGLPVLAAGDAEEIAEASAAMFTGRIAGRKGLALLTGGKVDIPPEWNEKAAILKSHPGAVHPVAYPEQEEGVFPVIHCFQEIPCNPCSSVCPTGSIKMKGHWLMDLPTYDGNCIGCHKCLAICPGLAITLVDYRQNPDQPTVTLPYELGNYPVKAGDNVKVVDIDGNPLGEYPVTQVLQNNTARTQLVKLAVPKQIAKRIAAFTVQAPEVSQPLPDNPPAPDGHKMVCLCERVSEDDILALVQKGVTDLNQIKAITRAGMGPCGSKTCDNLIRQVLRREGIQPEEIVANTRRPVFVEVPLGVLAGLKGEGK